MKIYFGLSLLSSLILLLLNTTNSNAQNFKERSVELGIDSKFGVGNYGGGISFSDFNGDGWDDLTFATEVGRPVEFYVNNRGTFQLLPPLINDSSHTKSVLWVDLDNDGDKDFFITSYQGQNRIYENTGNLNLVDITIPSGITQIVDPSYGAAFGDIDLDGYLDLYTTIYTEGVFINRLYKNNGNLTFTDITVSAGVSLVPNFSFQGTFIDINNNLYPDLYIVIDKHFSNVLFKNLGNSQFSDVSLSSGSGIIIDAMNSGGGDYDNDGDFDLYITNTPGGNVLLRNNGDETFTDVTNIAGVAFNRVGWATSFFDYDNDGDLDMYVSALQNNAPNALYVNNGDGTFSEPLRNSQGLDGHDQYYSLCNTQGDFNHDGWIDLVVSNEFNHPFNLWQNENFNSNNWLKIDPVGTVSNRDGIGVWIKAYCGSSVYSQYTFAGDGFLGQRSDYTHFGIGSNNLIDSLVVFWPSGFKDVYFNLKGNQVIKVVEGTSVLNPNPCPLIMYFKPGEIINSGSYIADLFIKSQGTHNSDVGTYKAGDFIILSDEFEVEQGMVFTVYNQGCPN